MKILVVGCGSIGKRHIRNIVSERAAEVLAFDLDLTRLKEAKGIHKSIRASAKISEFWNEEPEVAFICLPTALHLEYGLRAADKGCHLFIEKPLSSDMRGVEALIKTVERKRLITMVGCNMRFYWAIKKIKELLDRGVVGRVVSARIEAGQHLPDWHPQEDYRKMYSARRDLGGGIILDAIHEIDYAMWFFGDVTDLLGMSGRLSSLEIETEDIAEISAKFKKGPIVSMHMDYVQRSYSRSCKIIGEEGTIQWSYGEHCVRLYSAKTRRWRVFTEPEGYESNQMFIDELRYFMRCLKEGLKTCNDIRYASEVLKVALAAKEGGRSVHV